MTRSKRECIKALRATARGTDEALTYQVYDDRRPDGAPVAKTIARTFGSWNEAKSKAGLTTMQTGIDAEVAIGELLHVSAVEGENVTREMFKAHDTCVTVGQILHKFGSWSSAKATAGLIEEPEHEISTEECLSALEDAVTEQGHSLTVKEYRSLDTDVCAATIIARLGSWNEAKDAIGEATIHSTTDGWTHEDVVDALQQVYNELGKSPTKAEYDRFATGKNLPMSCSIRLIMGDWNTAKEAAGVRPYQDGDGEGYDYGPLWPVIRRKILKRDGHACQRCSQDEEDHRAVIGSSLHVHHIIPFGEVDERSEANDLSNLVAVCASCHSTLEMKNAATQCWLLGRSYPSISRS